MKEEERKEAIYRAAEKHSRLKLKQKLETKDIYQDDNAGKVFKTPSKLLDSQRIITTPEATEEKIIVVRPDKNLDKKLAELPNHQVNVKVKTDDADEWNKKPRFSMPKRTEREFSEKTFEKNGLNSMPKNTYHKLAKTAARNRLSYIRKYVVKLFFVFSSLFSIFSVSKKIRNMCILPKIPLSRLIYHPVKSTRTANNRPT